MEVDYVLMYEGQTYAIEVKSSRIRNSRGLEDFISRFPSAKPTIIDLDKGTQILAAEKPLDILKLL